MRKRLGILLGFVAVFGVAVAAVIPAGAVTGWKTFGEGSVVGRGSFGGSPHSEEIAVYSTTRRNPEMLRVVIDSKTPGASAHYWWEVQCWRETSFPAATLVEKRARTRYDVPLPIRKKITRVSGVPIGRFSFCNLKVWTGYHRSQQLRAKLQARYP
jgi:hypothetical protein